MSRLTLTGEGSKLIERLAKRGARKKLFDFIGQFMFKQRHSAAGFVVRAWKRKGGKSRTGSLVRGIAAQIFRDENGLPAMEVGVLKGPSVRYAGIQEHGTKSENPDSPFPRFITPKKGKALAMPVGEALTPAGVARYSGPRNYPEELSFFPIQRGDVAGLLVLTSDVEAERERVRGTDGEIQYSEIEAVYVLLYRARIRPKFYIRDGVKRFMPNFSIDLAEALVMDFLS